MKPGVLVGHDYLELVAACKDGGYALPAVNVVGTHSVNAVMEAAAKAKSDVIIQVSNGGAAFFGGGMPSSKQRARRLGAASMARHVHAVAADYGICVALNTDHANRGLLPWIDDLIEENQAHYDAHGKPLFSSHMLDLSEEPPAENIATSKEYLERLAKLDISLEIELGVTGGEEDGVGSDDLSDTSKLYTQPSDVWDAYSALTGVGHFTIAAAFGNVHGVYKPGNVKLKPSILADCQAYVAEKLGGGASNPCDFVFHGGSGSSLEQIREAIGYGVVKMNIDTDTQFAFSSAMYAFMSENDPAFRHQLDPETGKPYKSLYDPRKCLREGELGMVARLQRTFEDLGSAGRSIAQ